MGKAEQPSAAKETVVCPICDCNKIDREVSECPPVCTDCGYVIQQDHDEDVSIRDPSNADTQSITEETWVETYRVENATQQRLAEAFDQLEAISNPIDVPADLRSEAADIYCEAFKRKLTDGREASVTITVCLRIASLRREIPIPIDVLIDLATISRSAFTTCYSDIATELDVEQDPPSPADYLSFLEMVLDLDQKMINDAQRRLEIVTAETSVTGKNPAGFAAAAVYMVADGRTQADMSEAVGVSTETIRQRVGQFREVGVDE
jgi:transcription initiation factor TFIIB